MDLEAESPTGRARWALGGHEGVPGGGTIGRTTVIAGRCREFVKSTRAETPARSVAGAGAANTRGRPRLPCSRPAEAVAPEVEFDGGEHRMRCVAGDQALDEIRTVNVARPLRLGTHTLHH